MDLALAIFDIGVGLGVLTAGVALAFLAWRTTPLIRETRALTKDLRRLARAADEELRPLAGHVREATDNVELVSEDLAVKLERLGHVIEELQDRVDTGRLAVAAGRREAWSVESAEHTREDERDG